MTTFFKHYGYDPLTSNDPEYSDHIAQTFSKSQDRLASALGLNIKPIFMADGGVVPEVPRGTSMGLNKPKGTDTVPAMLTPKEFVFPDDVTTFYGTDKLNKMIEKARTAPTQTNPEMKDGTVYAAGGRSPEDSFLDSIPGLGNAEKTRIRGGMRPPIGFTPPAEPAPVVNTPAPIASAATYGQPDPESPAARVAANQAEILKARGLTKQDLGTLAGTGKQFINNRVDAYNQLVDAASIGGEALVKDAGTVYNRAFPAPAEPIPAENPNADRVRYFATPQGLKTESVDVRRNVRGDPNIYAPNGENLGPNPSSEVIQQRLGLSVGPGQPAQPELTPFERNVLAQEAAIKRIRDQYIEDALRYPELSLPKSQNLDFGAAQVPLQAETNLNVAGLSALAKAQLARALAGLEGAKLQQQTQAKLTEGLNKVISGALAQTRGESPTVDSSSGLEIANRQAQSYLINQLDFPPDLAARVTINPIDGSLLDTDPDTGEVSSVSVQSLLREAFGRTFGQ